MQCPRKLQFKNAIKRRIKEQKKPQKLQFRTFPLSGEIVILFFGMPYNT